MGANETKQGCEEPLTDEEKQLVRYSWDEAMKNMTPFSVDIFMRIFQKAPAAQNMFRHLNGIPLDELRDHPRMKAHGLRVSAVLNCLVQQVDDTVVLAEMFKNVARTHYKYNVVKDHYDLLEIVLIEALQGELKDKFTKEAALAWGKAYRVMENAILATYKELESQQG